MSTAGEVSEVRMVNDIARQFAHLDREVAVARIREHLDAFWDPRMRTGLLEHLASGGDDVDPLARDAVAHLG